MNIVNYESLSPNSMHISFNSSETDNGLREITSVSFDKKISRINSRNLGADDWGAVDHDLVAQKLIDQGATLYSVILFTEHLEDELYDDPNYCSRSHDTYQPAYYRDLYNNFERNRDRLKEIIWDDKKEFPYSLHDRAEAVIKKWNLPDYAATAATEDENLKYRMELKDNISEAFVMMELLEAFKWHKEMLEEEHEELELSEEEKRIAIEKEMFEYVMPRVETRYERKNSLPYPFAVTRIVTQYYFMEYEDAIDYSEGCSIGSSLREDHGRMAHAFMVADGHKSIPTLVMVYDSRNRALLSRCYDGFMAYRHDLTDMTLPGIIVLIGQKVRR